MPNQREPKKISCIRAIHNAKAQAVLHSRSPERNRRDQTEHINDMSDQKLQKVAPQPSRKENSENKFDQPMHAQIQQVNKAKYQRAN